MIHFAEIFAGAAMLTFALAGVCRGQAVAKAGGQAQVPAAAMQVNHWFALDAPHARLDRLSSGQKLDLATDAGNAEIVTVFGRRRPDDRGGAPLPEPEYEAGQSEAAQRLYAMGPEWASPEHQRLMSTVKDALGLCGGLGGWLTCPNR